VISETTAGVITLKLQISEVIQDTAATLVTLNCNQRGDFRYDGDPCYLEIGNKGGDFRYGGGPYYLEIAISEMISETTAGVITLKFQISEMISDTTATLLTFIDIRINDMNRDSF
jgi:hypothetical protein